ncbi:DMT family transporter [Metabacillus iocasae]|uniref:Drug/metabolite transporter (DMT)-like permease n=1 Tax=Priestia iocasae TaxID=2291674 RepID=A0ABS2QU52_9BACI|nr:DMT family transporter [Metabacillus iocasae]MBM7702447.1 drug/metabolite transporter (DMT)-like permease [Metabacillus iocasae]
MEKYKVYLLLVLVMLAWGMNVVALKILVTNFAPVTMTAIRVFIAGLFVLLFLYATKQARHLSKKEFVFITLVGLLNVVGHHVFLSLGLKQTSASNGGLILGMAPILTTICAVLFLGTKLTFLRFLGVLFGFTGVVFIVLTRSGGVTTGAIGDLFVFLSLVTQAVSYVFIKKAATTLDARLMTGWMLVTGAFFLLLISFVIEPGGMQTMTQGSAGVWAIFFGSALIATAFGHMMYNQAVQHIGAAEAAIFGNLNPFFALLSSAIFLNEAIRTEQLLAFLLIVAGVLMGSGIMERRKAKATVQA